MWTEHPFGTYLNRGGGCAWAGHKRAKLLHTSRLNENTLESDEKAGAFDPTGSGKNCILTIGVGLPEDVYPYLLKNGCWLCLGRTQQSETLSIFPFKNEPFGIGGKSWCF